jgi:anthranilate phosphoribosyltransferase
MVVLNAAAGLVVCGLAGELAEGVEQAGAAVDDGRATRTLGELVAVSRAIVQARAGD